MLFVRALWLFIIGHQVRTWLPDSLAHSHMMHALNGNTISCGDDLASLVKRKLAKAKYCLVCQCIKDDGREHKSRRGHPNRQLTSQEEQDFAARVIAEASGPPELRADRVRQQMADRKNDGPAKLSPRKQMTRRLSNSASLRTSRYQQFFKKNALTLCT